MISGSSLAAEGRVLERADQDGGCSAAAGAASSHSIAQALSILLVAVCTVCSVLKVFV